MPLGIFLSLADCFLNISDFYCSACMCMIVCVCLYYAFVQNKINVSTPTDTQTKGARIPCLHSGFLLIEQHYSHNPQRGTAYVGGGLSVKSLCTSASDP